MIRWLAARRWRQLLVTLVAAALFTTAAVAAIQVRNRSRVDLSLSGAISGRMTATTSSARCVIGKVMGSDQWDGTFVGAVGGKQTEVTIAITPYQGSGRYDGLGFPDPALFSDPASIARLYQLKWSVHIALSRIPPHDYATPDYATEPIPASRPATVDQLKLLTGLGRASVKIERDQMSGSIDAILMNSVTPTAPPVRLRGTFSCGKLDRQTTTANSAGAG